MGGAVAEAYQELLSEMWSGKNMSFSPFNFKVNSIAVFIVIKLYISS